jgi:oxygen-dependent protoporphyrinogen oxidase
LRNRNSKAARSFQKLSDRTIEAFLVSTSAQTAYPVLVVGAGISGLACAYHLQQAGIPVNAVEAATRPGGVIATKEKDGFHFDLGPQSFLTTEPLLKLIDALGLKDHLQHADPRAPRYILLRGQLVTAPMSPPSLFSTPLFSRGTKWRLLTEIARRTQPPAEDESIATFVRRKFGPELLERLVAPFVSGVYAGDPERLSMRASFPKIHEFESQYGSVLRGAMNWHGNSAASDRRSAGFIAASGNQCHSDSPWQSKRQAVVRNRYYAPRTTRNPGC